MSTSTRRPGSSAGMAGLLACLLLASFSSITPTAADGEAVQSFAKQFQLPHADQFVTMRDGRLFLGCKDFYFSGWNAWQLIEAAQGMFGPSGKATIVEYAFDRSVANGLAVFRMFGFAVDVEKGSPYLMMEGPGQYNEPVLRAMDEVLAQAGRRGLKAIIALVNNWKYAGAVEQFAEWCGVAANEGFFTDPSCRQMYKDHVQTILERTNTITGVKYKDDPTIMAWDLINEHRYYFESVPGGTPDDILPWIEEMSAFVKSIDSNHLVTVGEEGFYKDGERDWVNPVDQGLEEWPVKMGQDFIRDHSPSTIDFASIHIWPDNWKDVSVSFVRKWVREHAADAARMGKPLVIAEFGKVEMRHTQAARQQVRDPFFRAVFEEAESSALSGGPVQGVMFWEWKHNGRNDYLVYDVRETDTTWQLIKDNAAVMNGIDGGQC